MLSRIVPFALALTLLLASAATLAETSFSSTAPLPESGQAGVDSALQDALARLLVRVTGRRGAAELADRFPPATSIVRQFRVINGGRLEAEFDEPLVRRVLEEAGEGIWEGDRTRLYLWLVVNDGERWLFRPVGFADTPPQAMNVRNVFSGALSRTFEEVSALRGIEIDFAPVPVPQAAGQCAEKLWIGDFACLPPDDDRLMVLGRVAVPGALEDIEWRLREDGFWQAVWTSDATEAVHRVTDMLAERFMARQGPVRSYVLQVAPVPDLQAYASLKEGLNSLQAVREWQVQGAAGDELTLRITSRTAESPLREAAGRELRPQVAQHLDGGAGVLLDDAEQLPVRFPRLVELEQRQPQAFLVDLRRVDGDAPGRDAADVAVMGHRRRISVHRPVDEERLDDVEIRQMLAAGAVRVVADEDVPGGHVVAELAQQHLHDVREGTELNRQRQPLSHDLSVTVANGRGVVHGIPHHRRVGAPQDHQRHLVGDR